MKKSIIFLNWHSYLLMQSLLVIASVLATKSFANNGNGFKEKSIYKIPFGDGPDEYKKVVRHSTKTDLIYGPYRIVVADDNSIYLLASKPNRVIEIDPRILHPKIIKDFEKYFNSTDYSLTPLPAGRLAIFDSGMWSKSYGQGIVIGPMGVESRIKSDDGIVAAARHKRNGFNPYKAFHFHNGILEGGGNAIYRESQIARSNGPVPLSLMVEEAPSLPFEDASYSDGLSNRPQGEFVFFKIPSGKEISVLSKGAVPSNCYWVDGFVVNDGRQVCAQFSTKYDSSQGSFFVYFDLLGNVISSFKTMDCSAQAKINRRNNYFVTSQGNIYQAVVLDSGVEILKYIPSVK